MAWRMVTVWILAWAVLAAPASARAEVDLVGTWYVLIHYRDSATNNPDFDRWLDRIWQFEDKGSRMQWTEYPIVVYQDQSGRFERFRGVRSRVLAYWEPNANQRSQIGPLRRLFERPDPEDVLGEEGERATHPLLEAGGR